MRKAAAALLAAPVLSIVYLEFALRRSAAARVGLVVGIAAILGVAAIGSLAQPGTAAVPGTAEATALPSAAFKSHVQAGHRLRDGVTIAFSQPMDVASVAAAVAIQPAAPVDLTWDASGTELTISPTGGWRAGTYYLVTVGAGARDRAGKPLARPERAAFQTRGATTADYTATGLRDGRVPLDSRFTVTVHGSVDPAALAAAVTVVPPVAGHVGVTSLADDSGFQATFAPSGRLAADTVYTISLAPDLVDVDGGQVRSARPLQVRTGGAPTVVRFRPVGSARDVPRDAELSVRFSQPMDRASTEAAFEALVGTTKVNGELRWYEDGTVLLLDPTDLLPEGAAVKLRVRAGATSVDGAALAKTRSVTFTTVPKPTPKATPKPAPKPAPKVAPKPTPKPAPKPTPKPPSVGGSTWSAVEAYYLKLLNCTRGGGLVTSSGGCSSPGGSGLAALSLHSGLTTKVSRPYAKLLASNGVCSHTYGSTLASRLKRAGFSGYTWAGENLGCRSGDPFKAVLGSHLFFQAERSSNGGHWRNIMDRRFKYVGIGVWVSGGRVRLVTNFYAP